LVQRPGCVALRLGFYKYQTSGGRPLKIDFLYTLHVGRPLTITLIFATYFIPRPWLPWLRPSLGFTQILSFLHFLEANIVPIICHDTSRKTNKFISHISIYITDMLPTFQKYKFYLKNTFHLVDTIV
jgi:hypothetical protein